MANEHMKVLDSISPQGNTNEWERPLHAPQDNQN